MLQQDNDELQAIKFEMIQVFGVTYQGIGLSKLMGQIIGLLLFYTKPLSLDQISEELNMSKGPVSQITRRLHDSNLIKKIWLPGDRKDYYEINPHLFANAFQSSIHITNANIQIAQNLKKNIENVESDQLEPLMNRMNEMEHFYTLMAKHLNDFIEMWQQHKKEHY